MLRNLNKKGEVHLRGLLTLLTFIFLSLVTQAFANERTSSKFPEFDKQRISEVKLRCEYIKSLIVKGKYPLDCFTNYQHFGPNHPYTTKKENIKIANYNLLHPGTSKALFKDNELVAKIINNYDIVAGLELLGTVGRDEQNNKAIINFLHDAPGMIQTMINEKTKAKDPAVIAKLEVDIQKLTDDTRKGYELFRSPGYLKILDELKKLDPTWSLVLSPRGDSALIGSVEEFVGFFYRASAATLSINEHCQEFLPAGGGKPVACFIDISHMFMNIDLRDHFARRPFMATFNVNKSKINLITNHTVFTYSGDDKQTADLMQKTFGVDSHKKLGPGINGTNFARFAEIKNTLDFMNRFKYRYNDNKIIYMGDTNLSASNMFWTEILKSYPGASVLINEETTVSPLRFTVNGRATNGVANDYDHFILDKKVFANCSNGEVYNYYKSPIYKDITTRYLIRDENLTLNRSQTTSYGDYESKATSEQDVIEGDLPPIDDPTTIHFDYPLTLAGQNKTDKAVSIFQNKLTSNLTVKRFQVVYDDYLVNERIEGYRRRVFLRQLTNAYYYRFIQEVLSDHFPIAMECKF